MAQPAPRMKTRKKEGDLDRALRELAEAKAQNDLLSQQLQKSGETVNSLQASLNVARAQPGDVSAGGTLSGRNGPHREDRRSAREAPGYVPSVSIASITVPECKPSLAGEEIGRAEFEAWKELLITNMQLAAVGDEATRFMIFKIKAGPLLLEMFKATKSAPEDPDPFLYPFTNAMCRLTSYFNSGLEIMFQRRKLTMMEQEFDEPDMRFIRRVSMAARMCDYSERKEEEEIMGVVASGAMDERVRTLAVNAINRKGSLAELDKEVRQLQAVKKNEDCYRLRHGEREQAIVARVHVGHSGSFRTPGTRGSSRGRFGHPGMQRNAAVTFRRPMTQKWQRSERCFRCLSYQHSPNNCYAIKETCRRCGKEGHFKRACKSVVRAGDKRSAEGVDAGNGVKRLAILDTSDQKEEDEDMDNENKVSV